METRTTDQTRDFVLLDPIAVLMRTRWAWETTEVQLIHRVKTNLDKLVDGLVGIQSQHEKLRGRGTLTPAGLSEATAMAATQTFAPAWRAVDSDGWRKLPLEIGGLQFAMVPTVDKTDIAGAILRTDLRRLWLAMQTGDRLAMLANPTRDLAAALLEVPGAMLGLTARDAAILQQSLGENQFPDELAAIRDLEAVRTFAGTIMTMAQKTIMGITALDRAGFEALMWGGPLPAVSPAFRLNAAGTGSATTIEPGVVTGKLPTLKS